jgi:hypothetical protein
LRINQLNHAGVISGSGQIITASTTINSTGRIEAGAGDVLKILGLGTLQNQGVIAAEGGTIELQRSVNNTTLGPNKAQITLRNGVVRVGGNGEGSAVPMQNSGLLAAIGGQNDVYGQVSNVQSGQIAATNNSVLLFHDFVNAPSGVITVFPGSKAIFLEDLELGEAAALHANVAGTDDDTGFGVIEVAGDVALGSGSVEVAVEGAYSPQLGDAFPLITAGGLISGSLSLGAAPGLPNVLAWDLDISTNQVLVSVVPALAGDYNANGVVDAADYAVWRKMLNQTGAAPAADGDDNNVVDAADYDIWRANFGRMVGGSAGVSSSLAVPEPTSIFMVLSAVLAGAFLRWPAAGPGC